MKNLKIYRELFEVNKIFIPQTIHKSIETALSHIEAQKGCPFDGRAENFEYRDLYYHLTNRQYFEEKITAFSSSFCKLIAAAMIKDHGMVKIYAKELSCIHTKRIIPETRECKSSIEYRPELFLSI